MPDHKILDDDESSAGHHMACLVEFVFAMRDKLLNINENSYNNFMLRVGKLSKLLGCLTKTAICHFRHDCYPYKSVYQFRRIRHFLKGVAIDPTCIYIGRLTHVTNLMHFKWEVTQTHGTQPNTF